MFIKTTINNLDKELDNFLNVWKYTKSEYSLCESNKGHSMIGAGLNVYAQITSPIRKNSRFNKYDIYSD